MKGWCIRWLDWVLAFFCGGRRLSLALKWIRGCGLLKGRQTSRRGSEREHEGKRWLWWRRLRCEIKVREIKSVRMLRWMSSFLRSAVVWSRGYVAREKMLRCQSILKTVQTLSSVLFSLIYKRGWKMIFIYFISGFIVGGIWMKMLHLSIHFHCPDIPLLSNFFQLVLEILRRFKAGWDIWSLQHVLGLLRGLLGGQKKTCKGRRPWTILVICLNHLNWLLFDAKVQLL